MFAAALLAPTAASAQAPPPVEAVLVAPGWRVADLDRSTRFYAVALGLTSCTTLHHGAVTEVILCTDAKPGRPMLILIHEDGAAAAGPSDPAGSDKLVIRVPNLAGVSTRLKAAGYPDGELHAASGRNPAVLWVKDPDGHGLELLGSAAP
jgi:catechol 2,3-dioxygenase-like lactoylglutathione lyase family enzyme